MASMFWGLNLEPKRKYTQTIVKSFHISGAAINEGENAKLFITADKNKFCVATLNKNWPHFSLDLNFCKGDKIMFQTIGDATVSLTGYLHVAEDEDDDFDDEEYAKISKELRKAQSAGTESDSEEDDDLEEDDDDDDDDEDMDDTKLSAEYSSFLEDDDGDEEDDDDEEGEEDDSDDEAESEELVPKAKKAKLIEGAKKPGKEQNGVAKNEEKQQQKDKKKDKKATPEAKTTPENKKDQSKTGKQQQKSAERTLSGGVVINDVQVGNGPEAKHGKRVSVYYVGRLKANNKTFDTMQKGNGFKFALGSGEVIKGWDVGVQGMKVGGKRRITCPPHMAYGSRGHPPAIPPNSTLVFEVELKAVN